MGAFRSHRHDAADHDILPPQNRPSPRPAAPRRAADVVDATFETLGEAAPRSTCGARPRPVGNDNLHRAFRRRAPLLGEPASRLARVTERLEALLMRMSADFFSAVVAFVFVVVFALCGGFSLISGESADAHEGAGLDITHVTLTPGFSGQQPVLTVSGVVENRAARPLQVLPIRADLTEGDRVVSSALIAAPVAVMDGGHSRGFSLTLPHPGGKSPQLRLSFEGQGASRS
ncbi:hypothetical protein [Rhizobium sp. CSW-27]|uniref:hypothetical protein n=1 Tax=Rhizobium sp. CSW-27 TaxID=2839985 RepID=UPI001C034710|nr:hypothetical protein [Rhizobium sp. CSW-27]MBT9370804.1 hypothetical protein [Rhizobium sp. CSW-27]